MKISKYQNPFYYLIAWMNYPLLWLFLKVEWLIKFVSQISVDISGITVYMGKGIRFKYHKLIAKHVSPDRFNMRMDLVMEELNIQVPASMTASALQRLYYKDGTVLPEWKLNPKATGKKFASVTGLKTPKTFVENIKFCDIEVRNNIVIKQAYGTGANGVFIINGNSNIRDVKNSREIESWQHLDQIVQQLIKAGVVPVDSWIVEEYISDLNGNPSNDVKFNVFYGRVGWIAEIQRYPKLLYCITDRAGCPIDTGLYKKNQLFEGHAIGMDEITMAEEVSLKIPAPFMRIDFLRSNNGLVFGEFTPCPGVIGRFPEKLDQKFGKMYHMAEARLRQDLLAGKQFKEFREATGWNA